MAEEINDLTGQPHSLVGASLEKTGLQSGIMISITLIIYFLFMKYFHFMDSPIAWLFNFIILFVGSYLTYRRYQSETKLNVDYLPGLLLGCITTVVSVLPYTLFVYIFFSQSDPLLIQSLKDNILLLGSQISPIRAAVATMVEGISSGFVIAFIMMQYFKSGFKRTANEKTQLG